MARPRISCTTAARGGGASYVAIMAFLTLVFVVSGFSVTGVAAQSALTPPNPPPAAVARQTLRASHERATRKLEPLTRAGRLEHETVGAQGRTNALIDNLHEVEEPALVQPPLSGPWSF